MSGGKPSNALFESAGAKVFIMYLFAVLVILGPKADLLLVDDRSCFMWALRNVIEASVGEDVPNLSRKRSDIYVITL